MRTQWREHPVIGVPSICVIPSAMDEKFEEYWRHFEPRVRRMAADYCMDGQVGAEHSDLVQTAQVMLMHCLRKFKQSIEVVNAAGEKEVKSVQFSTYYYSCLRNEYVHLLKRCFPRRRFQVKTCYLVTGTHESINCTGAHEIIKCSGRELDFVLERARGEGKTYSVRHTTAKTRYALVDSIFSIEAPVQGKDDDARWDDTMVHEALTEPGVGRDEPMTVEQIIEAINRRIPDRQLRNIAISLFQGEKMAGPQGLMRKYGMHKHQAARVLTRIRQLLAGEFGLTVEGMS